MKVGDLVLFANDKNGVGIIVDTKKEWRLLLPEAMTKSIYVIHHRWR